MRITCSKDICQFNKIDQRKTLFNYGNVSYVSECDTGDRLLDQYHEQSQLGQISLELLISTFEIT